MKRTIIDFHILQSVPPSNINRDDTGSPKTAIYGGVRRARVSSQAWKRATRLQFQDKLDVGDLGVRTRRVVEMLKEEIEEQDPKLGERARELAVATFKEVGIEVKVPDKKTTKKKHNQETDNEQTEQNEQSEQVEALEQSGYLVFVSRRQIRNLARAAIDAADTVDPKKALKDANVRAFANSEQSLDISLFGRMVADQKDLGVDAAAQIAHAISVHGVETEFDYYTAVDDRNKDDEPGAGMIGTVEFNSSTLYRYATLDVNRLADNLGDEVGVRHAVEMFAESFVRSMPTGKQNTFANRTLPEAVVVIVRESQPINLVGAFENPIREARTEGRVKRAAEAFRNEAREIESIYSEEPVACWVTRIGADTSSLDDLGEKLPLNDLISSLGEMIDVRVGAQA